MAAAEDHDDRLNYALLVALYTLQGIPMGLSASIPFLIQQKLQALSAASVSAAASSTTDVVSAATQLSYQANAIFALCSWPFSLKLLWAPLVDACFFKQFGRRKSWLVPVQAIAGLMMVTGANFVERQLGLDTTSTSSTTTTTLNVQGVTLFFFVLYFLMATQDIAVDGWALTLLSKKNRGRGPICNSIGQNIGYFLSFVGFLALNDVESSQVLWRPLLGLPSNPTRGLVSLQSFLQGMGYFMLATTTAVALFKREVSSTTVTSSSSSSSSYHRSLSTGMPRSSEVLLQSDRLDSFHDHNKKQQLHVEQEYDEDHELDASEIGLRETYRRLWAVCQLPAVQSLFVILLTYRLPTALNDNVKFLKAVEYGLSKSTTALLSPTVILPLGILVPLVASKVWHGDPLQQFMTAYQFRVTLVPLLDTLMLWVLKNTQHHHTSKSLLFWGAVVASTAAQAICASLQFNAQMVFFAHCVDPAIGGSYMTLLNTAANLGGTYPASLVLWLVSVLTRPATCHTEPAAEPAASNVVCTGGRDPFGVLQLVLSGLGCVWVWVMRRSVHRVAHLPEDAWRTHWLDDPSKRPNGNTRTRRRPVRTSSSMAYNEEEDEEGSPGRGTGDTSFFRPRDKKEAKHE